MCGVLDLSRGEWLALSGIFSTRGVEIRHRGIRYKSVFASAEPPITEADIRSAHELLQAHPEYGKS